jgi:hypothetical protein
MSILITPLIAKHVIFPNIRLKLIRNQGILSMKIRNQQKNKRENPIRSSVGKERISLYLEENFCEG